MGYRIATWTPGDGEEVLALAIDIGGGEIALRKMFVAGTHRGRAGLARALMARLHGWARRRRVRTIYLGTTAVMSAAHRFYERQGFATIDPSDLPASFPRMEVDSRFYRRELEAMPG